MIGRVLLGATIDMATSGTRDRCLETRVSARPEGGTGLESFELGSHHRTAPPRACMPGKYRDPRRHPTEQGPSEADPGGAEDEEGGAKPMIGATWRNGKVLVATLVWVSFWVFLLIWFNIFARAGGR